VFKIENVGKEIVVLGKRGAYLKVNGKYLTHYSGEKIEPGKYLVVDSTFKVDTTGRWEVTPGVCIEIKNEQICHEFKTCSFNVFIRCPDEWMCLTTEEASERFGQYVKYSNEICGYQDKIPKFCYRGVSECPESCQCIFKSEAEKNGMFPCGGLSELTFCGYENGEEKYCYQQSLPDLRISDVWVDESTPGVYTKIKALVYNYGKSYAGKFVVAFFVDRNYVGEVEVNGLKPNELTVVAIDYPKICSED